MNKKSLHQCSEIYLKLLEFVSELPHGEMVLYSDIEHNLGVNMNRHNKDRLRMAIMRNNKEYTCLKGIGYRLASSDTSMPILADKLRGIDQKRRRADKAYKVIITTFLEQLTPQEQTRVLFYGSVLAAVKMAADNGRKLYGPANTQPKEALPLLPK